MLHDGGRLARSDQRVAEQPSTFGRHASGQKLGERVGLGALEIPIENGTLREDAVRRALPETGAEQNLAHQVSRLELHVRQHVCFVVGPLKLDANGEAHERPTCELAEHHVAVRLAPEERMLGPAQHRPPTDPDCRLDPRGTVLARADGCTR